MTDCTHPMVSAATREHTPGPWFVVYEPVGDDDAGITGYEPSGELCSGAPDGPILSRTLANETLKAAAPDLLEAALAQEELAALRFRSGETPEAAITRVRATRRAAIAKATGQ